LTCGDVDVIDQELRLLAAVRTTTRELGGQPSLAAAHELLDERLLSRLQ
jgi:hypothetical protein